MSAVGDTLALPVAARSLWTGRITVVAIAAITIVAIFWQTRWGTVPDTSWLITVCERMLAGERLYVDVIETNPPFSIWLYTPAVALAHAFGIAPEILVHAETYIAALAGLAFAGWIVRRAGFEEADELFVMAPAVYALLVLFPGNVFTQREHIGMALFLPMLVLMAWRLRGGPSPSLPLAVAAAGCGSVLLLVKPHYALMVLLPVLFICWRRRSFRPLFAPEHWIIGLICSAYLAMVLAIHPEYFGDVYPMLAEAYLTLRFYEPVLLKYGPATLLLGLAVYLFAPRGRMPELACTALLASAAGIVTLVWQAKAFSYHAYPALFLAILAVICLSCSRETRETAIRRGWFDRLLRIVVLSLGVLAGFSPAWKTQKSSIARVEAVHSVGERPTIVSISLDLAVGHPLSRMADGDYRSTHASLWAILGVEMRMRYTVDDPAEVARLKALRDRLIVETADEIGRIGPDVILGPGRESTWSGQVIRGNPRMAQILKAYRIVFQDDWTTVLIRADLPSGNRTTPLNG